MRTREDYWHGSTMPRRSLKPGTDGGIHIGTFEQAEMRNAAFLHRVALLAPEGGFIRAKDTGGNWKFKIDQARRRGRDGIVYLNRFEGVSHDSTMRIVQEDLGDVSDRAFARNIPEAKDSLIVLDESSVIVREIIPWNGRVTLYHGTTEDHARDMIENGFRPDRKITGANGGRPGYLYLTTDRDDARWFSNQAGSDVVLKFRIRARDLLPDPEDAIFETVWEEMLSDMPAKLATIREISPEYISEMDLPELRGFEPS